jgi:tetratricopeptide (TPR) repeat protein
MCRRVLTAGFVGVIVVLSLLLPPAVCGQASPSKSTSDYIHYRLGVKYKSEGKLDLAIEEFRKVLAAYPDNYNTYMHLAQIREAQGHPDLAVHELKMALKYNPGWAKAQKALARMYEANHEYDNALKEWQQYQEVCDPDERDSVQMQLDKMVSLMKGKPVAAKAPVEAPAAGGTPAQPAASANAEELPGSGGAPVAVEGKAAAVKNVPPAHAAKSPKSQKVAALDGEQVELEFKRGVQAYQDAVSNGQPALFDTALSHLRTVIAVQPAHSGAYYYGGLIRRRLGQNEKAKYNFVRAVSFPGLGFNAHFYLGKIYGEEKNYPEAIKRLKEYVAKTDYEAGKREAQSLIERFEAALTIQKGDTVHVDVKAVAEDDMHREVSKIPPETPLAPMEVRVDSLMSLAIVDTLTEQGQAMLGAARAFAAGKFEEAGDLFKKVLVKYPKGDVSARCLFDIGLCSMRLKSYRNAENQFQQVIDRYPAHEVASRSMFMKALSYSERRESQRAEGLFREFIQKYRTHAWVGKAYEKLGDCYVDLEQPRQAVDAYSQAETKASEPLDKVYAAFKQGEAYFKIDNPQRALTCFERAIAAGEKASLFERVPDSYYRIADYYYRTKNYDKALDYYTRVARKYPAFQDTPWALFQMGNIYKNEKKSDLAIKAYKELMEKYPDDYWARQANWKMEDAVWENEYRAVLE